MLKKRTFFFVLISLIPLSFILTQCFNDKPQDPRGEIFAGSASCVKCHSGVYDSYIHTAHFQTSRPASADNISGSFATGHNSFDFGNGVKVVMEKRKGGLYQAGYVNGKVIDAQKFDITIGNVKAQTYLYWKDKQLFELPISYFNAVHSWTNSPGYEAGKINFNRPIVKRCLECHSSYAEEVPQKTMNLGNRKVEFDKAAMIYGIDCERCHGPAANHVNYHTEYPEEKKAKYITTFGSLTRAQKMDACAVCHSGNKEVFQRTAFAFAMGDTLAKFKEPDFLHEPVNPATLDVHGNQTALLSASKCFLMSNMDCSSCHNPHANNSQNIAMYTQKCLNCHSEAKHNYCTMAPKLGSAITNNCINCHMPQKPSNVISVEATQGKISVPYLVRTHRIAIYPEETKKILAFISPPKGGN